jgi:dephospho-CoA kinase
VEFYRISGLSVASEIALPGLIRGAPCAPTEVTIRRGEVPEALQAANSSGVTWQQCGEKFLLCIPAIARFMLTGGRDIVVAPEADADPGDLPIFILGTVFGILLHQREQIVLHASAVEVNGKAVVFCGASGAGKSTLAAALAHRGYPVVTDDVCGLSLHEDVPTVHPDGRHLKLWAQAIARLELSERQGARVRHKLEKFFIEPHSVSAEPLPLGAIYVLREARPPHAAGITQPNVVDATLLLRRNAYRPRLVRQFDQRAAYFHAAARAANAGGIYHLTRELNFAAMPDVIGSLERHWRDLRITESAP